MVRYNGTPILERAETGQFVFATTSPSTGATSDTAVVWLDGMPGTTTYTSHPTGTQERVYSAFATPSDVAFLTATATGLDLVRLQPGDTAVVGAKRATVATLGPGQGVAGAQVIATAKDRWDFAYVVAEGGAKTLYTSHWVQGGGIETPTVVGPATSVSGMGRSVDTTHIFGSEKLFIVPDGKAVVTRFGLPDVTLTGAGAVGGGHLDVFALDMTSGLEVRAGQISPGIASTFELKDLPLATTLTTLTTVPKGDVQWEDDLMLIASGSQAQPNALSFLWLDALKGLRFFGQVSDAGTRPITKGRARLTQYPPAGIDTKFDVVWVEDGGDHDLLFYDVLRCIK